MRNEYIRNDSKVASGKNLDEQLKEELLDELRNTILDLNVSHENYDVASGELVDYYAYRIKAAQAKYGYLLKIIKDLKVSNIKKII